MTILAKSVQELLRYPWVYSTTKKNDGHVQTDFSSFLGVTRTSKQTFPLKLNIEFKSERGRRLEKKLNRKRILIRISLTSTSSIEWFNKINKQG